MTWWQTPEWERYEAACGDAPGTRSRLLASATWQTRVVDLRVSEADLWRHVRKSYKALIHRAEHDYSMVAGRARICRAIHDEAAGRETRPAATWDLMQDWLDHGHALAVEGWRSGAAMGYVYCVQWGDWAYYHSAATLEPNLNHGLLWRAMTELKACGVRWFELGWMDGQDEKSLNIAHFKRGFGGVDIPAKEAPERCAL